MHAEGGGWLNHFQPDDIVVPVNGLEPGYSPRRHGIDAGHVERLVATGGAWPPILVQASSMTVIDGAHRVAAAGVLEMATVPAVLFDGDDDEARVEAIRRNRGHGLPLTLQDRKEAAAQLVARHADWSDGRIAEVCSLSPKTVGELRRRRTDPVRPTGELPESDMRIGRDGRRRPIRSNALRARIVDAITAEPGASLRTIAVKVHASPETVRIVRRALEDHARELAPRPPVKSGSVGSAGQPIDGGGHLDSARPGSVGPLPTIDPELIGTQLARERCSGDSAFASTTEGARFAAWFDGHDVEERAIREFLGAVPTSRSYDVVDEAQRRARFWAAFANQLERRLRGRPA